MTSNPVTKGSRRRRGRRVRQRRAVVAVVVLLIIAVALATSYSAMRSQTISLNVRQNAMQGVSARQAAMSGLVAGLREMQEPDWSGTGTTFSRALGTGEGFRVQFIAGDDGLAAGDDGYHELPYRVTLLVTGTASDPTDARRVSKHSIRAVVRFIPRALPACPSDWSEMQDYVVYQTKVHYTTLDPPCRVEGKMCLQGKFRLGQDYPNDGDAWGTYFYHQNVMRWNGFGDHRTITGRVDFDYGIQDSGIRDFLNVYMSVDTSHRVQNPANADWTIPPSFRTYRLFPGGPEYTIPSLPSTLANVTYAPSTVDNPLGMFYAGGDVTIGDYVTIRGTLFCRGRVRIDGTNVRLESVDIPPLYGESLPIRLPAVSCVDFQVEPGASCTMDGLLAAFGHVEVKSSRDRGRLEVTGRIITEDLDILKDEDWAAVNWRDEFAHYVDFVNNHFWVYFPDWMWLMGYYYVPTVTIKEGEEVQYHWHRPGAAIFTPHSDDFSEMDACEEPGLRWELIEIVQVTN